MRLRLGLLHDPEAQQRMHDREQRAAEEKKKKAEAPTVRSEEEQRKYDEQQAREAKERGEKGSEKDAKKEKEKEKDKAKYKIRPLSDARAIELGANFFSESFIFLVAVGLLLLERYVSNKTSSQRRDEIKERLDALEVQVETLQREHHLPELEALNEKIKASREARKKTSWWNPAGWWRRTDPDIPDEDDEGIPGEVEASGGKRIPGSVPGPPPAQAVKLPSAAKKESGPKETEKKPGGSDAKVATAPAPARVDTVEATKKER